MRHYPKHQSPWQRNGEDKEEHRDVHRQKKEPYTNTKNDSIREIDTIIVGPYVGEEFRKAKKNYVREAKDPPMMSYSVNSTLC